jgi:hypothetical protein
MRTITAATTCIAILAALSPPALADGMCGRAKGVTIVDLLIEMQKPQATSEGRSTTTIFMHDPTDDSLWGFSVANTTAHPAAACSRPVKNGNETTIETGLICAAGEKVCKSFFDAAVKRMGELREKLAIAPKP